MAAKEHQGLMIAVIIFAMLAVTGFGATFYFFKQLEEEQNKSAKSQKDAQTANADKSKAEGDTAEVKKLIGLGPEEKLEDVKKTFEADLKKFGDNFPKVQMPADQRHYRRVIEYLYTEVRDAKKGLVEAAEREKALNEKIAADADQKVKEFAKYTATLSATDKDLKTERDTFNKSLVDKDKKSTDLAKKFDDSNKRSDDTIKKKDEDIVTSEKEITRLLKTINELIEQRGRGEATAELIDGKITWVNQKSRIVWLNIGEADGLKNQTSFSVLGNDEHNPDKGKKKGKIEVTRVFDRHMSEARILEDDLANPLMPGDQIYSPIFQAGEVESFALIGHMDIDNDGRSDLKKVEDLILRSGGRIDAELMDDGKKKGEVLTTTRYLVKGNAPTGGENESPEYQKNYSKLFGEAQQLGVRQMDLREFLDHMGYKSSERVVVLGKGANPADFKPELPNGVQRKPIADQFKPRRPTPAEGKKSPH